MADNKTHTITLKGGMNEPWLVLGAASLDDLERDLIQAFPELDPSLELPELVWRAQALWAAVRSVVVGGLVGGSESPPAGQAPQSNQGGYGQQNGAQAPSGAPTPAPACQHGQRVWVAPANKPWKGWFCPADKTDPTKCKPKFEN